MKKIEGDNAELAARFDYKRDEDIALGMYEVTPFRVFKSLSPISRGSRIARGCAARFRCARVSGTDVNDMRKGIAWTLKNHISSGTRRTKD